MFDSFEIKEEMREASTHSGALTCFLSHNKQLFQTEISGAKRQFGNETEKTAMPYYVKS